MKTLDFSKVELSKQEQEDIKKDGEVRTTKDVFIILYRQTINSVYAQGGNIEVVRKFTKSIEALEQEGEKVTMDDEYFAFIKDVWSRGSFPLIDLVLKFQKLLDDVK